MRRSIWFGCSIFWISRNRFSHKITVLKTAIFDKDDYIESKQSKSKLSNLFDSRHFSIQTIFKSTPSPNSTGWSCFQLVEPALCHSLHLGCFFYIYLQNQLKCIDILSITVTSLLLPNKSTSSYLMMKAPSLFQAVIISSGICNL